MTASLCTRRLVIPLASLGWALGSLAAVPAIPAGLNAGVMTAATPGPILILSAGLGLAAWIWIERAFGPVIALALGMLMTGLGALAWGSAQDAEALFVWRLIHVSGAISGLLVLMGEGCRGAPRISVKMMLLAIVAVAAALVHVALFLAGWREIGLAGAALAGLGLILLQRDALDALRSLSKDL